MIIEIQVELEILRKEFKIVGEEAHYGVWKYHYETHHFVQWMHTNNKFQEL